MKKNSPRERNFWIFSSRSGEPTMEVRDNNNKKVLLHSEYEPQKEAEKLINNYDLKDKKIIVILGLGLGYHLKELIKKVPKDVHLWVVEKREDIYRAFLNSTGLNMVLSREGLQFFIGEIKFSALLAHIQKLFQPQTLTFNQILIVSHPPSFQLDPLYYEGFSKQLRDAIYYLLVSHDTGILTAPRWAQNDWENILEVIKGTPVKNLFEKFKDKPAIIISGGPSLDQDINKLPKVEGKAILICLGTTFRPLIKKGIIPDLTVAIDAGAHHIKYFKGIKERRTCLVANPIVCPQVFQEFKGRKFICSSGIGNENPSRVLVEKYLGEVGGIEGGITVATIAFELARLMGCNPIILMGQDLSFPSKMDHAQGTAFISKADFNNPSLLKVPSNDGKEVPTYAVFLAAIHTFEEQIENFPGICINTSPSGALIKGTKIMSFKEAFRGYCEKREKENFKEMLEILNKKEEVRKEELEKIIEDLRKTIKEMKMVEGISSEGIKIAKELFLVLKKRDEEKNPPPSLTSQAESLAKDLRAKSSKIESSERVPFFLAPWTKETYVYLYKIGSKWRKDAPLTADEANLGGAFCGGINGACKSVIPLMERALKRLEKDQRKRS